MRYKWQITSVYLQENQEKQEQMAAGRWCSSEARHPSGWSLAGHREHVGQALGEVSFSGSFTEASGGAKDHRCGD